MSYLRAILLSSPFRDSLDSDPTWTTEFDVVGWKQDGYSKPLAEYPFDPPRTYATHVDPRRRSLIEHRIEAFGDHPQGLGKFTRTMFAQDLRRDIGQCFATHVKARWSLEEWSQICDAGSIDEAVVGSAWVTAGITPPPVEEPPMARYPLERAESLLEAAAGVADARIARQLRGEARAWLGKPYPRASAAIRALMATLLELL
jgi:hypothetical protein